MRTHARAVVIGGGVVGASVLYHLTKRGWTDVMLIERSELTSGSTWHAAGGMHTVNGDPNVAKLQAYTINLYKEIEAISGQSCGIHMTGGIMLAGSPERHDFLKMMRSRARYLGLDMEMISVDEAAKLFPLMDKSHFVGALYNTLEGHVDPTGSPTPMRKQRASPAPKSFVSTAWSRPTRGRTEAGTSSPKKAASTRST